MRFSTATGDCGSRRYRALMRAVQETRAGLLLLIVALLGACASSSEGPLYYFVSYADAAAYEGKAEEAALDRCASLDGAERGGQNDSFPPSGITVTFDGSKDERARLEECLRSLTNVRVVGPAEEGDPSPPQLVK